jgi:hypothetical protein
MKDDGSSERMLHPCQTVWTVDQLDNGDVITGGSDGKVRIWTKDELRYASADVREVSPNFGSLPRERLMIGVRNERRRGDEELQT